MARPLSLGEITKSPRAIVVPDERLQCLPAFSRAWYLLHNPKLAERGVDPLTHYLHLGGFLGCDPHPLFDSDWYLSRYPDVVARGLNPLVHYLRYGAAEGRDPHPLFDTRWYISANPDVAAKDLNPLLHFIDEGAAQGRLPNPRFPTDFCVSGPFDSSSRAVAYLLHRRHQNYQPAVSIIVPIFNKARYLSQCLESLLAQTLKDIEIVCVNDGSTDDSAAVLEHFYHRDPRITVLHSANNLGAPIARNIGINLAEGGYVQFTDADDLLPSTAIELLYRTAVEDNVDVVRGNLAVVSSDAPTNAREIPTRAPCLRAQSVLSCEQLWIPWWHTCYLISRPLLLRNRISYPSMIDGEDPVFVARVLVNCNKLSTSPEITYYYRQLPTARRTSLRHVLSFVAHAAMVRDILSSLSPRCWTRGYQPFLFTRFEEVFLRNWPRLQLECDVIALAIEKVGIAPNCADVEAPPPAIQDREHAAEIYRGAAPYSFVSVGESTPSIPFSGEPFLKAHRS